MITDSNLSLCEKKSIDKNRLCQYEAISTQYIFEPITYGPDVATWVIAEIKKGKNPFNDQDYNCQPASEQNSLSGHLPIAKKTEIGHKGFSFFFHQYLKAPIFSSVSFDKQNTACMPGTLFFMLTYSYNPHNYPLK
jgi:hypothetical protein